MAANASLELTERELSLIYEMRGNPQLRRFLEQIIEEAEDYRNNASPPYSSESSQPEETASDHDDDFIVTAGAPSSSFQNVMETDHTKWKPPEHVRAVVRKRNAALRHCKTNPSPEQRRYTRYLQREAKRCINKAIRLRDEMHYCEK